MSIFDVVGTREINDAPKNSKEILKLFKAASSNQLEIVTTILLDNPAISIDEQVNGFDSFLIAAKKGHFRIVSFIHSHFPSIIKSQTSDNQRNALLLAAYEGHFDIVNYVSTYLADTADMVGNNALHYACWGGHLEIVIFLIEKMEIDANTKNFEGMTPLQFATAANHLEVVQYLTSRSGGLLTMEVSSFGYNSLHRAAMYGSINTLKVILRESQNVTELLESKAENGTNALHLASQNGHFDAVELLVTEYKAPLNSQNDYGLTPLHLACIG